MNAQQLTICQSYRKNAQSLISILHTFVLQIMDGPCQLSQSTRLDRVFSILEVDYCAPGNSGLARE